MERLENALPEKITSKSIDSEFTDARYNHLHHVGYLQYFERERESILNRYGLPLPVAQITDVRYVAETHAEDQVEIKTLFEPITTGLVFHQQMQRGGEVVMGAKITCGTLENPQSPINEGKALEETNQVTIHTEDEKIHNLDYFHYLEAERLRIFKEKELGIDKLLRERGIMVPVIRIDNANFSGEVGNAEEVTIRSRVSARLLRLFFDQQVERNNEIIMRARITCALVDEKTLKPLQIPPEIYNLFV